MFSIDRKPNAPSTRTSPLKPASRHLVTGGGKVNAPALDARAHDPGFDFARVALAAPSLKNGPKISSPGDGHEGHADDWAERVMHMASPGQTGVASAGLESRREGGQPISTRTLGRAPAMTDPALDGAAAVRVARQGGAPLTTDVRAWFEPRFGHDFGRVRVHADSAAAGAARAIRARAYTVGCDIVFGSGEYAPATAEGRRLLAHELAHVLQQRRAASGADVGSPMLVQRSVDFGEMYRSGRERKVRSHLKIEYDTYKQSLGGQSASSSYGGHALSMSDPLTREELLSIFPKLAQDLKNGLVMSKTVDDYVQRLNQAFHTFEIDTVEAQASYLANAWHESDQFRFMTETEKSISSNQPYQVDPTQVRLNTTWLNKAARGEIPNVKGYQPSGTINPLHDWQKSFIGRGPVQVTHRHNYVQALAVMERRAEELEARDPRAQGAKALRAAIDKIKTDPRQAANPQYAFMFSAAFMKMPDDKGVRGDDKATRGQVTSWMGKQTAAARQDKQQAYQKAYRILMEKRSKQYGYDTPGDPLREGGFGPDDATIRVRPGPVRRTLIGPR